MHRLSLVAAWHAENVLTNIGENQVVGHRRDHKDAGLAELPLYVIVLPEAVATVRLEGGVSRIPRSFGGKELRHVGLRAALLALVKEARGFEPQHAGRLYRSVGPRDGELNPLVLADGAVEDPPLPRVATGPIYEPPPVPDGLRCDEDPLHVHSVQYVPESLALFADKVFSGDPDVSEKHLVRVVVDHGSRWTNLDTGRREVYEEGTQPLGLFRQLLVRGRPGQEEQQVGVPGPGGPVLVPVDNIDVPVADSHGLYAGGVRASVVLCHPESLEAKISAGDLRQVRPFLLLRAVPQQSAHSVHLSVAGTGVGARAVDLLEDDCRFGDAQPHPPVLF